MKIKTLKKFGVFLLIAAVSCVSLLGCNSKESTSSNKENTSTEDPEDAVNYTIGVCLSIDNDYYNSITTGFLDAVYDTIGEENVTVKSQIISEEHSGEAIIQEFLNENVDLIFANGKAALSAASISTVETPIIGAGVIDFKTTLHILDDSWNRYTNRNITGISGSPSVSNQLSLLLETNPTLDSIGILYSPEDTDSIYQNEILENYLDEAGIPWKEYELTSSTTAAAEYEAVTEDAGSVILAGEQALASAKEGAASDVESFGDDGILSDILSPNSARSPKISKFWTTSEEAATDQEGGSVQEETVQEETTQEEATDNTSIIETAVSECDALYIAAGSTLTDQIETITSYAHGAGVSTLGGDMTLGQYTYVTLYSDPYDMGYRAGKLVKRIVVDGENPGEIKIGLPSANVKKLYQSSVAQLFEKEFPKSFTEYNEFVSTYVAGSETTRVSTEEGEDD